VDRYIAPPGHINLIPSQPVFALSPYLCVLSGEVTNTNSIVFGLTRLGLEATIYLPRGEHTNHSNTDAVKDDSYIINNTISNEVINQVIQHRYAKY
jgi:hypothetical protein